MSDRPALPVDRVSRNRKRSDPKDRKEVKRAVINTAEQGIISCNCGWSRAHNRLKVREDAAQRHLDKAHEGFGLWL